MTAETESTGRGMVVVVEDERTIAELERLYLTQAGFGVHLATDGAQGLADIRRLAPVAVIIDVGLPGMDGTEVVRALRAEQNWVPVVFVTAHDSEIDRVVGLELGADDYLTKPFSPRELVARVRTVLRRSERVAAAQPEARLVAGDLVVDRERHAVEVAGRAVELTATEFSILATLAAQPGRVFTRSQLLDAVHGVAFESYERAIDAHVKNIRRKLELDPHAPRYLLTVHGVGYRVADPGDR